MLAPAVGASAAIAAAMHATLAMTDAQLMRLQPSARAANWMAWATTSLLAATSAALRMERALGEALASAAREVVMRVR